MITLSSNPTADEIAEFYAGSVGHVSMQNLIPCEPIYKYSTKSKKSEGSAHDLLLHAVSSLSALRHPELDDLMALGWNPLICAPPREYPGLAYYRVKHIETGEIKIACLSVGCTLPMFDFLNNLKIE